MDIEPTTVTDAEFPERSAYAIGTFLGERVTARADDLVPIKNHLPARLGIALKTRSRTSSSHLRAMRRPPSRCTAPTIKA